MRKHFLIAICVLATLASCKKTSPIAPSNTISTTIDGVNESFNANIVARLGTGVQQNSDLLITATNGTAKDADGISITINSNSSIAKAVYVNTSSTSFPSLLYSKGSFSLTNPNYYTTDVHGNNLTTIVITSLTSTNIQGTFSGKLVLANGSTIKSVTDGKFNVNFQ